MRFLVTYRTVAASRQISPSADVSAGNELTEEIDAPDAVEAARIIQEQPGRKPGDIDILSVEPLNDHHQSQHR